MSRNRKTKPSSRRRYTDEFKTEVLSLAERVGVSEAAGQLQLQTSQIYSWHSQAESRKNRSALEQALTTENAKLKRQLAEKEQELQNVKKAAAYFAKNLT